MTSGDPCQPSTPSPCPPPVPEPPPCEPEPPPSPKLPHPCPPPLCAQIPDPGNPCNYTPPACVDPEYPDLRKLKKKQCHFQKEDGLPVFLKGGASDRILYQGTLVVVLLLVLYSLIMLFTSF